MAAMQHVYRDRLEVQEGLMTMTMAVFSVIMNLVVSMIMVADQAIVVRMAVMSLDFVMIVTISVDVIMIVTHSIRQVESQPDADPHRRRVTRCVLHLAKHDGVGTIDGNRVRWDLDLIRVLRNRHSQMHSLARSEQPLLVQSSVDLNFSLQFVLDRNEKGEEAIAPYVAGNPSDL